MTWALVVATYDRAHVLPECLRLAAEQTRPPVEVFPNGVPDCGATSVLDDPIPTIIWAARVVPPKDPQILIRAAATLKREGQDFRMVIAGSASPRHQWYFDQTRELIRDLDLGDRIEMPGWIDDLPAIYRRVAIGVQTSNTEGLSMTLLEQMMAGLAIVATDVGDRGIVKSCV